MTPTRFPLHIALVVLLVIGVLVCGGLYWRAHQREAAAAGQAWTIAQAYHLTDLSTAPKGLSWRVHLLPNLGEEELYRKLRLDEPWDSPHNLPLVAEMPVVFRMPDSAAPRGWTTLVMFDHQTRTVLFETQDADAAPWTKPDPVSPPTSARPLRVIDYDR